MKKVEKKSSIHRFTRTKNRENIDEIIHDKAYFFTMNSMTPKTIQVGFTNEFHNGTIQEAAATVWFSKQVAAECKKIEFFPLYNEDYPSWLQNQDVLVDSFENRCKYFSLADAHEQTKKWNEAGYGTDIISGAILFQIEHDLLDCQKHIQKTHYSVPNNVRESISVVMESRYGEENVFVSSQVLTLPSFVEHHAEFNTQAYDALVLGQRYIKHIYDEQEYQMNHPAADIFCIPVSVRKVWNRVLGKEEFLGFISSISTDIMPEERWGEVLCQIAPSAKSFRCVMAPITACHRFAYGNDSKNIHIGPGKRLLKQIRGLLQGRC